jgi:uncharacterized membrane protein
MSRFINNSLYRPEIFLSKMPLWNTQINGYPVSVIFWNFLLAALAIWVTYWLVSFLRLKQKKYIAIILLSIAWLLLAPNTAYLLTDARHIIGFCPSYEFGNVCASNAWMVIFFFAFAAGGWLSFVWVLRPLRLVFLEIHGVVASWVFILSIIPVMALGVLLGLVNRWNSWEVFTDPLGIFYTILTYVTDLTYLMNWLIISVLFYILYFSGEKLFKEFKWEQK